MNHVVGAAVNDVTSGGGGHQHRRLRPTPTAPTVWYNNKGHAASSCDHGVVTVQQHQTHCCSKRYQDSLRCDPQHKHQQERRRANARNAERNNNHADKRTNEPKTHIQRTVELTNNENSIKQTAERNGRMDD